MVGDQAQRGPHPIKSLGDGEAARASLAQKETEE